MSSHGLLEQLRRLDRSSSEFHSQVNSILYEEEYKQWVQTVQGDDLVGLVEFLDEVFCCVSLLRSHSSHHRLSVFSTLSVPPSRSVCANSGMYAATE